MAGEGALESQQAAAARIPYENIDANQRGIGLVMSSFFHAADISRRRQQLEQALMISDQKAREQERWHDIEMQNFQNNAATKMYAMQLREESMGNLFAARAERLALDQTKFNEKVGEYRKGVEGEKGLYKAFGDPNAPQPGTQEFNQYYWDTLSKYAEGTDRAGGKVLAVKKVVEHNTKSNHLHDKYNSDQNQFVKDAGNNLLGFDQHGKVNMTPLENPDMWKDQYRDAKGNPGGEEKAGQPGWTKTGKKYLPIYDKPTNDPSRKVTDYKTVDQKTLDSYLNRYSSLKDQASKLPEQIVTADVKPVVASSATSPYPIAPRDPSQRHIGTSYQSPATGKIVTWTENGWTDGQSQ